MIVVGIGWRVMALSDIAVDVEIEFATVVVV